MGGVLNCANQRRAPSNLREQTRLPRPLGWCAFVSTTSTHKAHFPPSTRLQWSAKAGSNFGLAAGAPICTAGATHRLSGFHSGRRPWATGVSSLSALWPGAGTQAGWRPQAGQPTSCCGAKPAHFGGSPEDRQARPIQLATRSANPTSSSSRPVPCRLQPAATLQSEKAAPFSVAL